LGLLKSKQPRAIRPKKVAYTWLYTGVYRLYIEGILPSSEILRPAFSVSDPTFILQPVVAAF